MRQKKYFESKLFRRNEIVWFITDNLTDGKPCPHVPMAQMCVDKYLQLRITVITISTPIYTRNIFQYNNIVFVSRN